MLSVVNNGYAFYMQKREVNNKEETFMKTLYFEGAGCENTGIYDLDNCRIRTAFTNDNGDKIYLELTKGFKATTRHTSLKGGKPLKHPITTREDGFLYVDFCHYITPDKDDCNQSRINHDYSYLEPDKYTKANILKFVNERLNSSFEDVIILPWLSGYCVHEKTENGYDKYFLMEDFQYNPNATEARRKVYYETAKEFYNPIYEKHYKEMPNKHNWYNMLSKACKYGAHSIVRYDDKSITLRSHTYRELIDDNEREHTFELEV